MKFVLFGLFNQRLVQTEEDHDSIRKSLISSSFDLSFSDFFVAVLLLVPFGLFSFECMLLVYLGIGDESELDRPREYLKAFSVRSVYFESVRCLVVFDISYLSYWKLRWALEVKERRDEYDPKTNQHDTVSSDLP